MLFFIYCTEWFHQWLSESWRSGWHCQSHRSDHRERRVMGSGEEKTFGTLCYSFLCLRTTWSDKGGLLRRLASTKPHLFLLQLAEQVIKMVPKQTVEDRLTHFSRNLDPQWLESHPGEIKMLDQVKKISQSVKRWFQVVFAASLPDRPQPYNQTLWPDHCKQESEGDRWGMWSQIVPSTRSKVPHQPACTCQCAEKGNQPWGLFPSPSSTSWDQTFQDSNISLSSTPTPRSTTTLAKKARAAQDWLTRLLEPLRSSNECSFGKSFEEKKQIVSTSLLNTYIFCPHRVV